MTHPKHTGLANHPNGCTLWRAIDKPPSGDARPHSGKPAAPFLGWYGVDRPAQSRSCSYWASVIEFSILTECRGRLPCSQSLSAPS
jgi:hypothetical protein